MEISYSAQVQQVLFNAMDVAKKLNHTSVGTEHLLIGIVKIQDARLTQLLEKRGITERTLIRDIQPLSNLNTAEDYPLMTRLVRKIFEQAEKMAAVRNAEEINLDDLSLSLLQSEDNVALELLRQSGIHIEELIKNFRKIDFHH